MSLKVYLFERFFFIIHKTNFAQRDVCKVYPFTINAESFSHLNSFCTVQNPTQVSDEVSKCFVNKLISQMWLKQGQKA